MHIIIHMSVNHWEPGFFFSFQSFSFICTVFHSNLGTLRCISIPGLLLKQVFPSFFTCCEPPCLQTSAHTYTICSATKWRKKLNRYHPPVLQRFYSGEGEQKFWNFINSVFTKTTVSRVISDFFTHSFTFATCLRHFHHQFSAVFRQKKLLLKDGGGGMGWKQIGCLLIKSCHQKPCHHKTNRNSTILLNSITRKLRERHFRGSQEANCLPRTLPTLQG